MTVNELIKNTFNGKYIKLDNLDYPEFMRIDAAEIAVEGDYYGGNDLRLELRIKREDLILNESRTKRHIGRYEYIMIDLDSNFELKDTK